MPKKSQKKRVKYRGGGRPKPSTVKEVNQRPQPLPLQPKEVPVAKSLITIAGQADNIRRVPQELRRILFIAGALLVLLIVLSLLVRFGAL